MGKAGKVGEIGETGKFMSAERQCKVNSEGKPEKPILANGERPTANGLRLEPQVEMRLESL